MKKRNEYADEFGAFYDRIPKAVFAAIAYSVLGGGGGYKAEALDSFYIEWRTLYDNGIISQKPYFGTTETRNKK